MNYQINCLICISNNSTATKVYDVFLNMGIAGKIVENMDCCYEELKKSKFDFLFLDFDFGEERVFSLIDTVRNDENLSQIFILGTALSANGLFIKRIQSYNLIGFYVKPIDCERLQDKMNIICKKFKNHVSDRKYIRITPKDDDLVRAFFKLKSGKRISSKVLDISIGGLAISLYSDFETIELAEGNLLEHIIFEVDNKEIDVDAKIVKKNGLAVALQFTHFYLNSYDSLLKYIMKNLSESV